MTFDDFLNGSVLKYASLTPIKPHKLFASYVKQEDPDVPGVLTIKNKKGKVLRRSRMSESELQSFYKRLQGEENV